MSMEIERGMAGHDVSMTETYRNHKYKITLLVTIEEELAIMKLFSVNGWAFIRVPAEDYPTYPYIASDKVLQPTAPTYTHLTPLVLTPSPNTSHIGQQPIHSNAVQPPSISRIVQASMQSHATHLQSTIQSNAAHIEQPIPSNAANIQSTVPSDAVPPSIQRNVIHPTITSSFSMVQSVTSNLEQSSVKINGLQQHMQRSGVQPSIIGHQTNQYDVEPPIQSNNVQEPVPHTDRHPHNESDLMPPAVNNDVVQSTMTRNGGQLTVSNTCTSNAAEQPMPSNARVTFVSCNDIQSSIQSDLVQPVPVDYEPSSGKGITHSDQSSVEEHPMQTFTGQSLVTNTSTMDQPPSVSTSDIVQPELENTTESNYLSDCSDTISTTEEVPSDVLNDIDQDLNNTHQVKFGNSSCVSVTCNPPDQLTLYQDTQNPGAADVLSNVKVKSNKSESSCEDIDVKYAEKSYFQIPPDVIEGLQGNTEIISRTKALLVTLSNELKGLTTSKLVTAEDNISQQRETHTRTTRNRKTKEVALSSTLSVKTRRNKVSNSSKTLTTKSIHVKGKKSLTSSTNENATVKSEHPTTNVETRDKLNRLLKKRSITVNNVVKGKGGKKKTSKKIAPEKEKNEIEISAKEETSELPERRPGMLILYEDGDVVRNEIDKHIDEMSLVMNKNGQLVCCMCKESFENEDLFKKHADRCLFDLYNLRGSHTYHCTDCLAYFRQAYTLLRHRHSEVCYPGQDRKGTNVLTCEFCKKSYPSRRRSEYIHHIQVHKNVRPFKCEFCDKDFVRWTTLRDHKRIHTGEKPYKCQFCPLTFVSGSGQRNHEMVRHRDIPRTHICEKCGAAFKFRSGLTSHIKDVHDMPVMYTCEYCQKSFSRKGSLTHHRRVHNNQRDKICEICGKGFIRQAGLTAHMKRHRNERSFFCKNCGKGFYTKINLIEHERTHTGDKPFACALCNYQCAVYSNSIKHAKARHPEVQHVRDIIVKSSLPSVNLSKT